MMWQKQMRLVGQGDKYSPLWWNVLIVVCSTLVNIWLQENITCYYFTVTVCSRCCSMFIFDPSVHCVQGRKTIYHVAQVCTVSVTYVALHRFVDENDGKTNMLIVAIIAVSVIAGIFVIVAVVLLIIDIRLRHDVKRSYSLLLLTAS